MKKTTRMMVVLLVALALVATACGAAADKISDKVAEQAAEKLIEAGGNGDVNVDISGSGDDAGIKIETEDGSMSFGAGTEMPEGLEIPVPDGGTVQTSIVSDDTIMVSLYYDQGRYDEIVGFYDDWTAKNGDSWEKSTFSMTGDDDTTIRNTMWIDSGESGSAITVGDCAAIGSDTMDPDSVCVSVTQES